MSTTYSEFVREILLPRMKRDSKYIVVSEPIFAEYEMWLQPQERIWHKNRKDGIEGLSFRDKIVTVGADGGLFQEINSNE